MAITCWLLMLLNDVYYDYVKVIFFGKKSHMSIAFYLRIIFNCFNTFIILLLFKANGGIFKNEDPKENQLKIMGGIGLESASKIDVHQKMQEEMI